jgi:hypothetical protein
MNRLIRTALLVAEQSKSTRRIRANHHRPTSWPTRTRPAPLRRLPPKEDVQAPYDDAPQRSNTALNQGRHGVWRGAEDGKSQLRRPLLHPLCSLLLQRLRQVFCCARTPGRSVSDAGGNSRAFDTEKATDLQATEPGHRADEGERRCIGKSRTGEGNRLRQQRKDGQRQ